MILRKPYAFLVKHFKLIHVIILLCGVYLTAKTWNVVSFFGTYIKQGQKITGVNNLPETYITPLMNLLPIVVILTCAIIIYLLYYKGKPLMLYVYIALIYFLIFLSYRYLDTFLYGLAFDKPNIRFVNILRDVYRVLTVIQIPVIVLSFVRAIGFDFKKFDFKRDLLELGIEAEDNEEYEFELKLDKEDIQAKFKKRLRLFKYFYKENKFLFVGLGVIAGAVVVVLVVNAFKAREIIYKQNKVVDLDYYEVQVLDSYKTTTDNMGKKFNNAYFYLILKMRYHNTSNEDMYPFLTYIDYGDGMVRSTRNMSQRLSEFGVNYYRQTLKPDETRDFTFIYEVPIEYYDSELILRHLKDIVIEDGQLVYLYTKVRLSPKEFDEKATTVSTSNVGDTISLSDSIYGNSTFTIEDVSMNSIFYYNITKCSKNGCQSRLNTLTPSNTERFNLALMRIKYKLDLDYDTLGKNYKTPDFISDFGSIRFVLNGKEYNNRLELTDVTPYVTNDYVFVQIRDYVREAEKVYLDLKIRDKVYTIILKDDTKQVEEGA